MSPENIAKLRSIQTESTDEPEVQEQLSPKGSGISYEIVSIVAYLIGVPNEQFGSQYLQTTFDRLEKNSDAKLIRCLCRIRSGMMRNLGSIITARRNTLTALDQMPDFFPPEAFMYLIRQNIHINTTPRPDGVSSVITQINQLITSNIKKCQKELPLWVNWEYVQAMFNMPKGAKTTEVENNAGVMQRRLNSYPFQCYINWPIDRPEAYVVDTENYLDAKAEGNILAGDKKFLILLYRINNDEFTEFSHISVADETTKQTISDFMEEAGAITVLVDCENSDPYRFCAMMRYLLEDSCRHGDATYGKIGRILLFDDDRTVDAWDVVKNYVGGIPVEHEEVERVIGHKSLVDIAMTAGACREYYMNEIRYFLIASSDSDYWGVIRSMPDAHFMVLAESEKFSSSAAELYDKRGIRYCMMNDFATNINDIKRGALNYSITRYINDRLTINIDDMLTHLLSALRIEMSAKECENTRRQLCARLKLELQPDGCLMIKLSEE